MKVGELLLRVTDPVSLGPAAVGLPMIEGVTVCGPDPSLVTLTWNFDDSPASTVAFSDVWRTSSELPAGVPPLMDSASCTAFSVLTRPAPWCSAGAPRSWAVLTMICLTSCGAGMLPLWVLA